MKLQYVNNNLNLPSLWNFFKKKQTQKLDIGIGESWFWFYQVGNKQTNMLFGYRTKLYEILISQLFIHIFNQIQPNIFFCKTPFGQLVFRWYPLLGHFDKKWSWGCFHECLRQFKSDTSTLCERNSWNHPPKPSKRAGPPRLCFPSTMVAKAKSLLASI